MKKLLLLSFFVASQFTQAQLNNRRLVVPEFSNNKVKTYVQSGASMVVNPSFTIQLNQLPGALATNASPNCVAMNGSDLYVAMTAANQRIYKFPNYGNDPVASIANVSQVTAVGQDYVGIAFDAAGNLYASEGNFLNTEIVKYSGANLATRTVLGNGGTTSYFANIAFDAAGNLWASDYLNNRIVVIKVADLNTTNAPIKALTNALGALGLTGSLLSNTDAALSTATINYVFTSPEGMAFDSTGALWVANNNDGGSAGNLSNTRTTLVKVSVAAQTSLLNYVFTNLSLNDYNTNTGYKIYVMPNSVAGKPQFGGLQIDKVTDRIYVNEQVSTTGMYFDIATIAGITTNFSTYQLPILSTNPGNGGIYLASNTQILGVNDNEQANKNVAMYPNPSNGTFKIESQEIVTNVTAFDVLGKEIKLESVDNNYSIANAQSGIYYIKITKENGGQNTKKLIIN